MARKKPPHVTLAHGNGGRFMRELIEDLFLTSFGTPPDARGRDAAPVPADENAPLMVTTDGFTVQPLEFPGGNLGSLAVHGVVNDLAVAGAEARWLTLSAILEEGLAIDVLERLVAGFAVAARDAGATVLAGDTKVVPRGRGGEAYFAVTGLGLRRRAGLELANVRPGDAILVSGSVGDHGVAVMLAREEFDLHGEVRSDCASVLNLCRALWPLEGLRFMRDPTRGGVATVAHEIALGANVGVRLEEARIPVCDEARSVCEILGFDPLFLACEGRVVAVVAAEEVERALAAWRAMPEGAGAEIIGFVTDDRARVTLVTEIGGVRVLGELEDDPLPRIC